MKKLKKIFKKLKTILLELDEDLGAVEGKQSSNGAMSSWYKAARQDGPCHCATAGRRERVLRVLPGREAGPLATLPPTLPRLESKGIK